MKIGIIGNGNVGSHLLQGLSIKHDVQVIPRDKTELRGLDLLLVAVPDLWTLDVCNNLPKEVLVAHTAGAVPMPQSGRRGVFYPLYSFSKNDTLHWPQVPILLEANSQEDLALLKDVARDLSPHLYELSSRQREQLHVSAVMVNNFTNHLYTLAFEHLKKHDIPTEVLHPIMIQGPQKAIDLGPENAQTGPSKRGDSATIHKHINALKNNASQELYTLMSELIQDYYHEL